MSDNVLFLYVPSYPSEHFTPIACKGITGIGSKVAPISVLIASICASIGTRPKATDTLQHDLGLNQMQFPPLLVCVCKGIKAPSGGQFKKC